MVKILDGRAVAEKILDSSKVRVDELHKKSISPTLGIVTATGDESTKAYQRLLVNKARQVGLETKLANLDPNSSQDDIARAITDLANNPEVHAIILQTPLPSSVDEDVLSELIPPAKDVDGANALSVGRLLNDVESFAPATAVAVIEILKSYEIPLDGARAVVIGRSKIAGKPAALLLLAQNATVTVCHSKTRSLEELTKQADVLVSAIGKANFVDASYIKPGCVIIDVGINFTDDGTIVGDVNAQSVDGVAGAISPVPGGVGPVTTAILLRQTISAAESVVL